MKFVTFEFTKREAMSSAQSWTGDAIDVALAADFEGSLSCLGIELGTENYDMSAPLHSLMQSVSTADYSSSQDNGNVSPTQSNPFPSVESLRNSVYSAQAKKTRLILNGDEDVSIKRFCVSSEEKENSENAPNSRYRHSSSAPDLRATVSHSLSSGVSVLSPSALNQILQIPDSPPVFSPSKNSHFQYVLGAATSIATKINEESMTYLNQGQSYEIKLKKLGDLTEMRGKMLKSIIRVGFQERRLQFSEKEQISQWQNQRIGERILEIDIPLSYGVYKVTHDPSNIHICEFLWDPTNEAGTGVFIRLNCISTEFTPKKHGGEKGAPFRIQIETFSHSENDSERLHVAACQVKVFKPKGADRKHKTDREKMSKRPQAEQDKYKTSYDCTVFTECAPDPLYITGAPWSFSTSPPPSVSAVSLSPKRSPENIILENSFSLSDYKSKNDSIELSDVSVNSPDKYQSVDCLELTSEIIVKEEVDSVTQATQTVGKEEQECLTADFTIKETANWLNKNNFDVDLFINYNGTDLLRLSRDDCIRICGNADGVRLYNTLICKPVFPKKVLFVRVNVDEVFQAVYLHKLCTSHLISKLAFLFHIPLDKIHDVRIQVSITAHYAVTNEVVINIQNESLFMMELIAHDNDYIILLKPYKEDST